MRVKTSITLDRDVLRAVDRIAGKSSRSRVIEDAVRAFLKARSRAERDVRDRKIMERVAAQWNKEMDEVLEMLADAFEGDA